MKKLTLINGKFDDENEHLSITEYPHLSQLSLTEAHDDYIEEFLVEKKTCLPNNLCLSVDYQVLKHVTQHEIIVKNGIV